MLNICFPYIFIQLDIICWIRIMKVDVMRSCDILPFKILHLNTVPYTSLQNKAACSMYCVLYSTFVYHFYLWVQLHSVRIRWISCLWTSSGEISHMHFILKLFLWFCPSWRMLEGSLAEDVICALIMRNSCRSFRDKRPRLGIRFVFFISLEEQQYKTPIIESFHLDP